MIITPDSIEDIVLFSAPIDRVWRAIANPEGLKAWFCSQGITGNLAPGEEATFGFNTSKSRFRTEDFQPPHLFSFRWAPGECIDEPISEQTSTLVTMRLREVAPGKTELHLVESGFASLVNGSSAESQNLEGWDDCFELIAKYVETDAPRDWMRFQTRIKAPIEKVWRAFSNVETLARHTGCVSVDIKLEPGEFGYLMFGEGKARIQIQEIQENRLFSYRWVPGNLPDSLWEEGKTTLVTFELYGNGEETVMLTREEGFAQFDPEPFAMNTQGWSEYVLPQFKKTAEEEA